MRFTRWRRRRFFALLGESGNVRMACELSGVGLGCIYRLRRTEAGFVAAMAAAKGKADARLGRGTSDDAGTPHPPIAGAMGPSIAEGEGNLVIRRGIGGRLRVMAAGDHWWASRHDAIFLGHLRVTGNVTASAKAAGFTAKSAWNRRERMLSFARAWDSALEEAENRLEGRLVAEVLDGTAGMDPDSPGQEAAAAAAERAPFDVWLALWLLKHWQGQGRIRRRRGSDDR